MLKHLPKTRTEGQLLILKLDVPNPNDVQDAFKTTEIRFDCTDVYNNVGFSMMGELESTPEEAQKMFDVNVWGTVNFAQGTIPSFRDINKPQGGRLWSVTSGAGLLSTSSRPLLCKQVWYTRERFPKG